jgi:hypothetical protein
LRNLFEPNFQANLCACSLGQDLDNPDQSILRQENPASLLNVKTRLRIKKCFHIIFRKSCLINRCSAICKGALDKISKCESKIISSRWHKKAPHEAGLDQYNVDDDQFITLASSTFTPGPMEEEMAIR